MNKEKLYNNFMEIIGKFSNDEIKKLGIDLIEYARNDELFNRYDDEDIAIFKRVIIDYNELKTLIDTLIKGGYTIEDLYDFVATKLGGTDITNVELNDSYKYIDFNYKDMCVSIIEQDNIGVYLGETIEIWNNKKQDFIGTFNNIRELEDIIEESENK